MLLGKYINKYYLKYAILFITGIAALLAVNWFQLYIPEELAKVISIFETGEAVNYADPGIKAIVFEAIRNVLIFASIMFVGRIVWRLTIFMLQERLSQTSVIKCS